MKNKLIYLFIIFSIFGCSTDYSENLVRINKSLETNFKTNDSRIIFTEENSYAFSEVTISINLNKEELTKILEKVKEKFIYYEKNNEYIFSENYYSLVLSEEVGFREEIIINTDTNVIFYSEVDY